MNTIFGSDTFAVPIDPYMTNGWEVKALGTKTAGEVKKWRNAVGCAALKTNLFWQVDASRSAEPWMPAWDVLAELMMKVFKFLVGESAVRGHRIGNEDHAEVSNEVTNLNDKYWSEMINEWQPIKYKWICLSTDEWRAQWSSVNESWWRPYLRERRINL